MRPLRGIHAAAGLLSIAMVLTSCTTAPKLGSWNGPEQPIGSQADGWDYGQQKAKCIRTPHYRIYTTIEETETLDLLPQLLEGALAQYRQLTPGIEGPAKPMDAYIFRSRNEWDAFTRKNTGSDAAVYLQIRSGGYTVGDVSAAYYIGRSSTFSVEAHEGWHQYCGRMFAGRLPPFLEEGLACMFESITWEKKLPRFNTSVNPYRAQSLRKAMDAKALWSLDKLIATHAGDIVGERMEKIDAFYGQSWAFARFLWEGENAKYRPALQKWLTETAKGTVFDPTRTHTRAGMPWSRRAVRPMIEHYLGKDLAEVEVEYQAYLKKIAYEELAAHWRS